jgi:hypothetical protein
VSTGICTPKKKNLKVFLSLCFGFGYFANFEKDYLIHKKLFFRFWVWIRDDRFYLFALFKALYIKLAKTSKYGRYISRFSKKN